MGFPRPWAEIIAVTLNLLVGTKEFLNVPLLFSDLYIHFMHKRAYLLHILRVFMMCVIHKALLSAWCVLCSYLYFNTGVLLSWFLFDYGREIDCLPPDIGA